MTKQDLWFIRVGIAFIVLVPIYISLTGVKPSEVKNLEERLSAYASQCEQRWYSGDLGELSVSGLRMHILNQPESWWSDMVHALSPERLRQLEVNLRKRPATYRHDQNMIRLHGIVKNYLRALDKAEAERIMDMWPEVKQDKEA